MFPTIYPSGAVKLFKADWRQFPYFWVPVAELMPRMAYMPPYRNTIAPDGAEAPA